MRIGSSGTQSAAMQTSGRAQLEEGMTQRADSEAMEVRHHPEQRDRRFAPLELPQQDAASSVDQPGVTR